MRSKDLCSLLLIDVYSTNNIRSGPSYSGNGFGV